MNREGESGRHSHKSGRDDLVTLALTGDVMLGRLVDQAMLAEGPYYPWGNMLPLLRNADLTLVNLECVVASGGQPWTRWPKVFHFRAGYVALDALKVAGVDFVSLANNHVLDYEEEALLEMLGHLTVNGIAWAGAGRNRAEAARPAILEASGIRLGVLSFTDNEPGWGATDTTPGTNYLRVTVDEPDFARVREGVAQARRLGADLVILSNHWGPNMRLRPTAEFRRFAQAAVDAGVDLYIGHSAHVMQGVEVYHGKPIIYDAGDFVDDYAVDAELRNDLSALILATVSRRGVERLELVPTAIDLCQVNRASGEDYALIADRLRELSGELGTRIVDGGNRLTVELSMQAAA